ncbi:SRPBCC family protein [Nocardioides alcanivorans]|uniref:SRPBCC family protein n=1 Tax=Nocardioides alcanivorans TaxID=2897352 RepID=UPI001F2817BB|nr:SRPBCC family protein [Nocardioides alcanivorans]
MGNVTATAEHTTSAAPEQVLAALADYSDVRPAILPGNYSDYTVQEGGTGAGTVVSWKLQATKSRVRDVLVDVTTTDDSVTETDRNSTMVTTFRVAPEGSGSKVVATTTWQGASGIGGFFERTFAPLGLRRIHGELLEKLSARLGG